jgi:hypothetical protein
MMISVIFDLQQFLFFYFILCGLLSMILDVLCLSNMNIETNNKFRDEYFGQEEYPGYEHNNVGGFIGNYINIIKASTGDFAYIMGSQYLTPNENYVFWASFVIVVCLATIIFLNFVVAEASASYARISAKLEEYIEKDRCKLISEAEAMKPYQTRNCE